MTRDRETLAELRRDVIAAVAMIVTVMLGAFLVAHLL
jgi:hypothetical protein